MFSRVWLNIGIRKPPHIDHHYYYDTPPLDLLHTEQQQQNRSFTMTEIRVIKLMTLSTNSGEEKERHANCVDRDST